MYPIPAHIKNRMLKLRKQDLKGKNRPDFGEMSA
jgi:hypothetical protein